MTSTKSGPVLALLPAIVHTKHFCFLATTKLTVSGLISLQGNLKFPLKGHRTQALALVAQKKCAEVKQDKDTASTEWFSSESEVDEAVLKAGSHAHSTLKGSALEGKMRKHGCSSFSMGMKVESHAYLQSSLYSSELLSI